MALLALLALCLFIVPDGRSAALDVGEKYSANSQGHLGTAGTPSVTLECLTGFPDSRCVAPHIISVGEEERANAARTQAQNHHASIRVSVPLMPLDEVQCAQYLVLPPTWPTEGEREPPPAAIV